VLSNYVTQDDLQRPNGLWETECVSGLSAAEAQTPVVSAGVCEAWSKRGTSLAHNTSGSLSLPPQTLIVTSIDKVQ